MSDTEDTRNDAEDGYGRSPPASFRRRKMTRPPRDLEERHQALNELFGFKPFPQTITRKTARRDFEAADEIKKLSPQKPKSESLVNFGNVLWVVLFGWWVALVYAIVGGCLFISVIGKPYSKLCWKLRSYFFWPFGKYIVRERNYATGNNPENFPLTGENRIGVNVQDKVSPPTRTFEILSFVAWILIGLPVLSVVHFFVFFSCWGTVVFIPMAKVIVESWKLLFKSPLELDVVGHQGIDGQLLLCTFESMNFHYFKYRLWGISVWLINLIPFVLLTIVSGYLFPEDMKPSPIFVFFTALLSIVPTAYFIGMAVSSISAQSNFAVGAVLNASFGSIVELILYASALKNGGLNDFIIASVTGSLLSTMLLLPGLSMVFGGLRYKEQHFNAAAAGVSNVLLIVSVIGACAPTIFYEAWGNYTLQCNDCVPTETNSTNLNCHSCEYSQSPLDDEAYINGARPLTYAISFVLPLAYIVGLIFTLKTHAYIYEKSQEEGGNEQEGHDAPEWGKIQCIIILFSATFLFALVSEELVDAMKPALGSLGLHQSFVGILFVGLASNSAEILNAVNFALHDNIALSIEIGASGTVQAALIQIPFLVLMSTIFAKVTDSTNDLILIFPNLNLFAIIFSVIVNNYLSINGKSNYFEGTALVLIYTLFVLSFYFVPSAS